MISVEKIGGTSMSRFHEVIDNIILKDKNHIYGRVFVVSAYAGVTNWLLEHKKTGEKGIYAKFASGEDINTALEDLIAKLKEINSGFAAIGLDVKIADAFIEKRIRELKAYLESMRHVLATGYLRREDLLLAGREMLAAVGEAHSAFNSAEILKSKGADALCLDLSGFDDDDALTIDERIHKAFLGLDLSKKLVIVTGYTKGIEGIMREFDRGYSEVTFCKVAVELKAAEAIIHKEHHLSSADPEIVGAGNTVIVGQTNFDVADQLADIGMEAIHPKAAKPLEMSGIAIRLKNTFDPDHPGTLVTKNYVGKEARIEVITGTQKVTLIEIHDPSMVGTVGFDLSVMEIFKKYSVSYILKTTNANSITLVIWEKSAKEDFLAELRSRFESVQTIASAVVCVIGSNIAIPGVLAKAAQVLAQNRINVNCVSQSFRQVNMQFVVDRENYKKAIIALNQALCLGK